MGKLRFLVALNLVMLVAIPAWPQETRASGLADAPAADTPAAPKVKAPRAWLSVPESDTAWAGRDDFSAHVSDFVEDQKRIWTSPGRARFSDAAWLVPLGGVAAGLFATDRQTSASLSQNPMAIRHYKNVSDFGSAGLLGASAGLYLLSFPLHNEHWRETGWLAGEAALNSLVTAEALKYTLRRERPYEMNGAGEFFRGGTSFPSEHAAVAWSVAGVIAHEYEGPLPKLLAYGLASAVSFARVDGRQHFPSDVFVGSTLGYLIGQSVYSRRHDPEIGGKAWQSPREFVEGLRSESPANMGSPYVPLDSWVYAAIERLAAFGFVKTATVGLRPWTRLECARLVSEAQEAESDFEGSSDAQELYAALTREFSGELVAMEGNADPEAEIESVYSRAIGVEGKPLTDNLHFGQTILNDYGRPLEEGFNTVTGSSGWTTAGPLVIYARGEYQTAPSAPSLPGTTLAFVSSDDGLPANPPLQPVAAISRFRLLDAYVGMTFRNWQFSFGKQSLWWGPSEQGAMLMTNNIEPIGRMFRVDRVSPFRLPSVLGLLGDIRMELFLGQLSGQEFINNTGVFATGAQGEYGVPLVRQPFLSGGKISFKFTPNFEFGMGKTTIYGGPGNPLTVKTLAESTLATHVNGESLGDGRSAADFSYRIPKLRNWLTVYGEGFSEDEVSPINTPQKSAWQGGLYLARVPKIPRLDLRAEGGFTDPVDFNACNACFYENFQYLSGYTNYGQLIGSWIGRAAQGEAISSTYWLGAQKKISLELRHRKIDRQYLPQGGTQNDVGLSTDLFAKSGFRFTGSLQYEQWQIPLIENARQSNVAASLQIGYWPQRRSRPGPGN
jgi:membrane-associated phospholipid phosphatase